MTRSELMREYEAAVEIYEYQCKHGGLGDIEKAKEEKERIGAMIDATTNATLEAARGEKKMYKVTNANVSGQSAHIHKELFGRLVNAVDLDPAGIKISISNKDRDRSRYENGKVIIEKELGLYDFLVTFVATMRVARLLIDVPKTNEELSIQELQKFGRTYAEERLDAIRAALTEEEKKEWDESVAEAEEKAKEKERRAEESRQRLVNWPIENAQQKQNYNETRKLEILEALKVNATYEYSWRIEELGVISYLERFYAEWLYYTNHENNEALREAETDDERVTILLKLARGRQREALRSIVKHREWARGGSPGHALDKMVKGEAEAQYAEWLDDVIYNCCMYLRIKSDDESGNRTLGW